MDVNILNRLYQLQLAVQKISDDMEKVKTALESIQRKLEGIESSKK